MIVINDKNYILGVNDTLTLERGKGKTNKNGDATDLKVDKKMIAKISRISYEGLVRVEFG